MLLLKKNIQVGFGLEYVISEIVRLGWKAHMSGKTNFYKLELKLKLLALLFH